MQAKHRGNASDSQGMAGRGHETHGTKCDMNMGLKTGGVAEEKKKKKVLVEQGEGRRNMSR